MDAVGSFLMDQFLKMQWLSDLIAIFIDALRLDGVEPFIFLSMTP